MFFQQQQPQQPQQQQTQQPQQQTSGFNFLCCGNPWDDIFGHSNENEQAAYSQKVQGQDWNNPFNQSYQPYQQNDESRSLDQQSVDRADGDVRSIGSGNLYELNHTRSGQASVLSSNILKNKWERKGKFDDPEVSAKTSAVNRAVQAIQVMKNHENSVAKTETTRGKKELTPEDIRDPETVPGMKCQVDLQREDEAKKKAFEMITTGNYPYNAQGGGGYTMMVKKGIKRVEKSNVQEIV